MDKQYLPSFTMAMDKHCKLTQEHLIPILMSEEYIAKTVTVVPATFSSKQD